jgi:hypothetical protein
MARVLQENFSCDAGGGRAFDFKPSLSRRQKYQRAGNPVVLPAQAWEVQTRLAIIAVGFLEDRLAVVATVDADLIDAAGSHVVDLCRNLGLGSAFEIISFGKRGTCKSGGSDHGRNYGE